jgi:hypothetical protein
MKEQINFFDIVARTQETMCEMLEIEGDKVIIGGHIVLTEGDIVELNSLKKCIEILDKFRTELSSHRLKLDRIDKILEMISPENISGGSFEEAKARFNYILHLKKAIDSVVKYLNIPQILEKDAIHAIRDLIDLVPGIKDRGRTGRPHHPPFDLPINPWNPITIRVCDEYTI